MKAIISGLPELLPENQMLLGQVISIAMHQNMFKVDGIEIKFVEDDKDV